MKILVTGATGNIGRMVVDELLALGADDVRALTVDPARAALPDSVEVVRGFVGRPEAIPFAGVDVMYLAPHIPTARETCRLAAEAGVGRIVDLAGAKGDHWQAIEDAVEASGLPHTHLEPGEFMANAGIWAAQIRAGDEVRDAYGDVANAAIAQEDIAAVAARVILEEGHDGKSYELTGPETLTRREKVAAIGRALGRDLTYIELPPGEALAQFEQAMGDYAQWYLDGLAASRGHPQPAVTTVADLTGRPALTYEQWARRHQEIFR
ncbi:nucleotide-diphosphate-sugar epimerase [Paractinoplanes deccanensis]|uniref:Nucleotide-diphosphate-sugar epimerase n=1 Tax=Paractinoplanes deccanensis TaxID=113561 RepID=A0ABQ3YBX6_9ACTN|nr:NAD(P)H-binding protein [Actinoplanes deccanensis]GID77528.1 nucleotide-diphosphate-sugar epimerase [Actinoplanes deccanensis]